MPSDDANAPADTVATPSGRLPDTVRPSRYDIRLAPDLDTSTFAGEVVVEVQVERPTDRLTCNAAELEVHEAWVEVDGRRIDATTELDDELEQVHVLLPESLAAGSARLHVRFAGVLNDKLRGFYRSSYTTDDGEVRRIAVTQFEPTDARRAFPCWDEPSFKAVFGVTLDVVDDLLAISNGPELERTPLDGGRVRIRFADTMPMSTYLVAFVVGPLETTGPVDVDGVPLRIVHRPGQGQLAAFALEVGEFALRWYADYYGIAYPGDKVDMVAVPDFAFGAMENLGCVVYRETLLLIDPSTATQAELVAVVDVITHELAHMWFGDLVTMSWWNGIWLNEAFATFMEATCADAFRPGWQRWMHFGRERSTAFDVDALDSTRPIEYPVLTPQDAEGMFDTLTYQKGSAVVRMCEQYLGADAFRDGIRRYLQTHQFGNTETGDLWDALEAETGEPVRATMDSWIFQGGFPLVTATRDGDRLTLEQGRFRYREGDEDQTRWRVPVIVRAGDRAHRLLLEDRSQVLDLGAGAGEPVFVNAGGHGFYRVDADPELRRSMEDRLGDLEPLERYTAVDDAMALMLRGDRRAADVARLLQRLADIGETDLSIWQLAASAIDTIDRIAAPDEHDAVSAWVRRLLSPLAGLLGDDVAADDDDRRRAVRGLLLGLRGVHGDAAAQAVAADLWARSQRGEAVDAELAAGALKSVAVTADAATFDTMLDRFRSGTTPQEQVRHLYAAATVADRELFDRYLAMLATDEVRSQNLAFAYRAALRNREHGVEAWTVVRDRWDAIRDRLPFNATQRLVEGVADVVDRNVAEEVATFLEQHPVPEAERLIAQHVDRMWVQVKLHERECGHLAEALSR